MLGPSQQPRVPSALRSDRALSHIGAAGNKTLKKQTNKKKKTRKHVKSCSELLKLEQLREVRDWYRSASPALQHCQFAFH